MGTQRRVVFESLQMAISSIPLAPRSAAKLPRALATPPGMGFGLLGSAPGVGKGRCISKGWRGACTARSAARQGRLAAALSNLLDRLYGRQGALRTGVSPCQGLSEVHCTAGVKGCSRCPHNSVRCARTPTALHRTRCHAFCLRAPPSAGSAWGGSSAVHGCPPAALHFVSLAPPGGRQGGASRGRQPAPGNRQNAFPSPSRVPRTTTAFVARCTPNALAARAASSGCHAVAVRARAVTPRETLRPTWAGRAGRGTVCARRCSPLGWTNWTLSDHLAKKTTKFVQGGCVPARAASAPRLGVPRRRCARAGAPREDLRPKERVRGMVCVRRCSL